MEECMKLYLKISDIEKNVSALVFTTNSHGSESLKNS
jgi:hypothetical protein